MGVLWSSSKTDKRHAKADLYRNMFHCYDDDDCKDIALYASVSALLSDLMYRKTSDCSPLSAAEFRNVIKINQEKLNWFQPISFSPSLTAGKETIFTLVEFATFQVLVVRGAVTEQDWRCLYSTQTQTWRDMENVNSAIACRADAVPLDCIRNMTSAKPTILCGHNLGGAVAILCALSLFRSGFDNVYCFAFGAPPCEINAYLTTAEYIPFRHRFFHFIGEEDTLRLNSFQPEPGVSMYMHTTVGTPMINCIAGEREIVLKEEVKLVADSRLRACVAKLNFRVTPTEADVIHHSMSAYFEVIAELLSERSPVHKTTLSDKPYVKPMVIDKQNVLVKHFKFEDSTTIEICGTGSNAALVTADLAIISGVDTKHLNLKDAPVSMKLGGGKLEFTLRFNNKGKVTRCASLLTENHDKPNMRLMLSNGFEEVSHDLLLRTASNVAVVGKTGAGKSHLMEALKRQSEGSTEELEKFDDGVTKAVNCKARCFLYEDAHIYETPGLQSAADVEYINDVKRVILTYHPRLLLIAFQAEDKVESCSIPAVLDQIEAFVKEHKLPMPEIFLVLTKAFLFNDLAQGHAFGAKVAEQMGRRNMRVFCVNSVRSKYELPFGVPELWSGILEVLRTPVELAEPPQNESRVGKKTVTGSIVAAVVFAAILI